MSIPTDTCDDSIHYPSLAIVVNNYNYARYLREALDSALKQMREGDEMIVVDDGSTHESPTILRQYQAAHGIKLIEQKNQGQMRTVRVGIDAAVADVIVLLDSDDYFLDGYLDRLRQIYQQHPEINYVFCNALVTSSPGVDSADMRDVLDRMELTPGKVGSTKWATLLFYEFVGVPTSGNSLHRSLANAIATLPVSIDATEALSPIIAPLLGISKIEQHKSGFTADGVIVRCASLLGALKYYDDRPGFVYRIHGSNKYAATTRLGRWYLRHRRKALFERMVRQHFGLSTAPTVAELRAEVLGRSFGRILIRRVFIRTKYSMAVLTSRGTLAQKVAALAAALGLFRREQ